MEKDICLHGREERKSGDLGSFVQEFCFGDLAVGALLACPANDELYQVHLLDHVLEGPNVRVRDPAAERDIAEGRQVFQQMVR